MIVDEGKYYLYRHIRLDINEVFYVGIGTKYNNVKDQYKRASSKRGRSDFWKYINRKTKITIDILLESNNYEYIKEKEIEFISLYGRRDLGLGTLVNMTNGGDGCIGIIRSQETKNKISEGNKGKKRSEETKNKLRKLNKGKKLSEETKNKLRKFGKGNKYSLGYKHTDETKHKMSTNRMGSNNGKATPILRYSIQGLFEKEYYYIGAAKEDGYSQSCISDCCRGKQKTHKNKIWKYKL